VNSDGFHANREAAEPKNFCQNVLRKRIQPRLCIGAGQKRNVSNGTLHEGCKARIPKPIHSRKVWRQGTGIPSGLLSHGRNVPSRLIPWVSVHDWNLRKRPDSPQRNRRTKKPLPSTPMPWRPYIRRRFHGANPRNRYNNSGHQGS